MALGWSTFQDVPGARMFLRHVNSPKGSRRDPSRQVKSNLIFLSVSFAGRKERRETVK